ncbi:F-box domain-containing protein [Favolaschia claudopus]|uniref:F-box domain-containing protein n=1 Tax=Favolaschia claudopus TaxID=2862362 RepID=A0AAW0A4B8_9AGAR
MSRNLAISQLLEDIDEISLAIIAQTAILHDLKAKRLEAQHKLNLFLDPMARLPLELQSYIFLFMDSQSLPQKPNPNAAPILFLRVCRLWRDIALATPMLWTKIQIDTPPCGPNHLGLCEMWLKRARSLPLSVTLRGPLRLDQNLQDMLAQYSPQLKDLTLTKRLSAGNGPQYPYVVWELPEESLPSLKTLSIEPAGGYKNAFWGNIEEWLEILRAAPRLSHCKMVDTFHDEEEVDVPPSQLLMLASLECMQLGEPGTLNLRGTAGSSSLAILRYLTLPALKVLTLSEPDIAHEAFLSFLSRSSPPLESLEMTLPHEEPWLETVVSRFLPLIPQLVTLDLAAVSQDNLLQVSDLFLPYIDLLASSSEVLPHLRMIVFRTDSLATIPYDDVLRMLRFRFTSCPARLERFELKIADYMDSDSMNELPNEEVRVGLQQLVRDGLKIHIGTPEDNML